MEGKAWVAMKADGHRVGHKGTAVADKDKVGCTDTDKGKLEVGRLGMVDMDADTDSHKESHKRVLVAG